MLPDPSSDSADDDRDRGDSQQPEASEPSGGPDGSFDQGLDAADPFGASAEQGLFLSVPAGSFDPDQFAQSGPAADMPPDPLLATIIDTVTDPDGTGVGALSDDQLIGVIAAARRLESRIAWYQLAAVAEFKTRSDREPLAAEFAADELACELHLTATSAAAQMDYSGSVTSRLPRCLAALHEGRLHPVHLRIIEDETAVLPAENAAKADAVLAEMAGALTFGKLRSAAHRLVLELDPEAAAKRKEAGRRNAEVRPFREVSGNAGMIARELPSAEVLASMQHVEQRALDLRAAGIPGTLEELRVRAYLDLLQERDTRHTQDPDTDLDTAPAAGAQPTNAQPSPGDSGTGPDDGSGSGPDGPDGGPHGGGSGGSDGRPGGSGPHGPSGGSSGSGPGRSGGGRRGADPGPGLAALLNITVPWTHWARQDGPPAEVDGFGPVDADDTRDLIRAAARDPRSRWCITLLNPDGTAAAHGCAPGRHPPPRPASPGNPTDPETRAGPDPNPGPGPNPGPAAGPDPPASPDAREWIRGLGITMTPITRGDCDHEHAETGYRPSRKLRHLIQARNAQCTAPSCGRPAVRCDLDHTVAWDDGGMTCECDLAPLCRHHHRCKQAQGWHLEQPEPGVLIWHTPSGRSYTTTPTCYPV